MEAEKIDIDLSDSDDESIKVAYQPPVEQHDKTKKANPFAADLQFEEQKQDSVDVPDFLKDVKIAEPEAARQRSEYQKVDLLGFDSGFDQKQNSANASIGAPQNAVPQGSSLADKVEIPDLVGGQNDFADVFGLDDDFNDGDIDDVDDAGPSNGIQQPKVGNMGNLVKIDDSMNIGSLNGLGSVLSNPQNQPYQDDQNAQQQYDEPAQEEDPMNIPDIVEAMEFFPDKEPAILYDIYLQCGKNKEIMFETIMNDGVLPDHILAEQQQAEQYAQQQQQQQQMQYQQQQQQLQQQQYQQQQRQQQRPQQYQQQQQRPQYQQQQQQIRVAEEEQDLDDLVGMGNVEAEQAVIDRQIRQIEEATRMREQQEEAKRNGQLPQDVNDMNYLQQQFGGGEDDDARMAAQMQAQEIAAARQIEEQKQIEDHIKKKQAKRNSKQLRRQAQSSAADQAIEDSMNPQIQPRPPKQRKKSPGVIDQIFGFLTCSSKVKSGSGSGKRPKNMPKGIQRENNHNLD